VSAAEALALLLEEHLEEADFLWDQREEALDSRDYDLDDLIGLEERLAAHVDALLIGGVPAWEMLLPALTGDAEGVRFAAACVALASGDDGRIAAVVDALGAADTAPPGILGALRHLAGPAAEALAARFLAGTQPMPRATAIDALGFRRVGPEPKALQAALVDTDPDVRAAALTAAGRLRAAGLLMEVDRALDAPEDVVRRAALEAGVVLGSPAARDRCRAAVDRDAPEADAALMLLGHLGDPADLDRVVVAARGAHGPAGVAAMGWLGATVCMPVLIGLCGQAETGPAVMAAVARLTGADPEAEELLATPPAEEDDEAPEVPPAPDPERLAAWWAARAGDYAADVRYRYGQPYDPARLVEDLASAPLADRHGAALERILADPDAPWLETRAMGLRQRAAMEAGR